MSIRYFLFYSCIVILLLDVVVGGIRYKRMDTALQVFYTLLVSSFISELAGIISESSFGTKAPIYHLFSILELFLITLYFLATIHIRASSITTFFIGLFCIALGLANLYWFQPLLHYNTNMLMFECFAIIAMALFALFRMALRDDIGSIAQYAHFRIWTVLLILWTTTFFFWAFLEYLKTNGNQSYEIVGTIQVAINLVAYSYIGVTFYRLRVK